MITQKQLTLADIFEDCKEIYESDKPQFLTLLENHIDLDEIVPISFVNHYYASTGRNRKYPLNAMLWALIIQRLLSIPTDSLLLIFLPCFCLILPALKHMLLKITLNTPIVSSNTLKPMRNLIT